MTVTSPGPLIAQSDHTLLLEVEHPQYEACRDFLVLFAELVKSPEFIHTYKGMKLVTGKPANKSWDNSPLGFRFWDVQSPSSMQHKFVPLETNPKQIK